MVGKIAAYLFDSYVIQSVFVKDTSGGVSPRDASYSFHFRVFIEG